MKPGLIYTLLTVFLIVGGLFLILGGFVYDVLFAGIPYQDPTPAMQARYDLHSMIASGVFWTGVVVLMVGCLGAFYRMVLSGRRKRGPA